MIEPTLAADKKSLRVTSVKMCESIKKLGAFKIELKKTNTFLWLNIIF